MNLTENKQELPLGVREETWVYRISNRIRQSLELQDILTKTVEEIRSFLKIDRVKIYRFHRDESGEVIAEAIDGNRLPSLLGLNFPADDIPPHAREFFLKSRTRSIVDAESGTIGLSHLDSAETGEPLSPEDIHYRSVDPCHVVYLKAMGVTSSLAVPILHHDLRTQKNVSSLWGLLVSHHSEKRIFSPEELKVVQLVTNQLSIAIAQSTVLYQTRMQFQREATINRVTALLYAFPEIKLQLALSETVAALHGSSGRLYIASKSTLGAYCHPPELYTCGIQPSILEPGKDRLLEEHPVWREYVLNPTLTVEAAWNSLQTTTNIYQEPQLRVIATAFRLTRIRGLLAVPLLYRQQLIGILTIFREEIETETLWAGQVNSDRRQLQPRNSFAAWREIKRGKSDDWTTEEIELAQGLCHQFSMAVHQYQLYQQIQLLNTNLECQVQDRTAQLQSSLEFASARSRVTDEIRRTLDLKTTLQTIVREVRNLLNTDRVVIYQFVKGWQGEVVVEEVVGTWDSLVGKMIRDDCFSGEYAHLYEEGGIRAINDVSKSDLSPCHQDFLRSIQVKANLVVPIRMGEQLWGLLIAHECATSRVWQGSEIELLQQLANEAAIAIQQAELYQQSCTAAEQQKALSGVITKIRESLDLDKIFQAATREVRQLLNADRVGVFRFYPESDYNDGEFVSENVLPGFTSILAAKIPKQCFGEQFYLSYRQGQILAIDDINNAELSECYLEILSRFQVTANLVIPLKEGEQLWGLLCIHQCSGARHWEAAEIDFVSQIAVQLGVALQQAELLVQTQHQAEQLTLAIQELQQTQTQLIQTEKMSSLGQLVAGIAHEINNPVNFIYGNLTHAGQYVQDLLDFVGIYRQHYPDPPSEIVVQAEEIDLDFLAQDLPKILTSMKVGADRIRQMVLSLRNFSRLDQADRKPVNIHEGIDSSLLILQHRLKANSTHPSINLVKDYGDLPLVECYAGPLNQVFMNVISNAIDALEQRDNGRSLAEIQTSPSQITITTSTSDRLTNSYLTQHSVVIRISDNGSGMTKEVQNQIFNPFFTTKPVGKGTGLGLSISYQIVVEKHGGAFKCISQLGQGTEFWIEIPVQ